MPADPRTLLDALFEAHFDRIFAYARRRTIALSDAEDAAAETFVVAWRRIADLPLSEAHQLAWLYGIARRVLANQRRAAARRQRLADRLRAALSVPRQPSPPTDVLDALAKLHERDQEILRLATWEGMNHTEIGLVLGISPNASAIRLHRARRRLAATMKGSPSIRTWTGWRGSVTDPEQGEEV
jgi:RNA polymerase sigma-70 factor (ECF subfamily)